MTKLIGLIDAATTDDRHAAASNDPLYDSYVWQSPSEFSSISRRFASTTTSRSKHRLSGSLSNITAKRTPDYLNNADPRFPGAPNQRDFVSKRPLISASLRSVLSSNLTSELRGGATAYGTGSTFGYPSSRRLTQRPEHVRRPDGFAIVTAANTTDWFTSNAPSWRNSPTYSLDETVTWLKAPHSMSFGGNLLISKPSHRPADGSRDHAPIRYRLRSGDRVVQYDELPGRLECDVLDAARDDLRDLTGRVGTIASQAVLDGNTGNTWSWVRRPCPAATGCRGLRAGLLESEADPHDDGRPPL